MLVDWNRFYKHDKAFIEMPFRSITKIHVNTFFCSRLNEAAANNKPIKDKAFKNMIGLMKQTFNYAVDMDYLDKSPYIVDVNTHLLVPYKKKINTKEIFLADEKAAIISEMRRRLKNNPSNTAPLAIILDFEIGVRKAELLALSRSDIEGNMIHIHRQLIKSYDKNFNANGFEIVEYTKSVNGDRYIPLTPLALKVIDEILEINKKYNKKYEDFLFVTDGHITTPSSLDAQLKRGCLHIGIAPRTLHKIRKTYASTLYQNGISIPVISKMLGHAEESTTLKHYIFDLNSQKEENRLVLEALQA